MNTDRVDYKKMVFALLLLLALLLAPGCAPAASAPLQGVTASAPLQGATATEPLQGAPASTPTAALMPTRTSAPISRPSENVTLTWLVRRGDTEQRWRNQVIKDFEAQNPQIKISLQTDYPGPYYEPGSNNC